MTEEVKKKEEYIVKKFDVLPNPLSNWYRSSDKFYVLHKIDPFEKTLMYRQVTSPKLVNQTV